MNIFGLSITISVSPISEFVIPADRVVSAKIIFFFMKLNVQLTENGQIFKPAVVCRFIETAIYAFLFDEYFQHLLK